MKEVNIICKKNGEVVGRISSVKSNWIVYDEHKKIVGKIKSIFGPVSNPYVKIELYDRAPEHIYLGGGKKWRKKRTKRSG